MTNIKIDSDNDFIYICEKSEIVMKIVPLFPNQTLNIKDICIEIELYF